MPLLAKLLATLFGSLFAFVAKYFVVDKGFKVIAIVSLLAMITAIFALFDSCTGGGVCSSAFAEAASSYPGFSVGLGIAVNPVTYAAASSYLVVWAACQLYVVKKRMVGVLMGGS